MNFNPLNIAIAQHYENVDKAINYLIDLYNDDVDITDKKIFNGVMEQYGLLNDGFVSERKYIIEEVKRKLC